MTERLDSPSALPSEAIASLASELTGALITRLQSSGADVEALARSMSLDPARVSAELSYLLVVTTAFCIEAGVGDQAVRAQLQSAVREETLSSPPLGLTDRGLRTRSRAYRDAFAHPHPELGRAYSVGRVFARYCDASHEVAVIEFAARTYMAQLPAMLASLRVVTGEQARP